jgi:hypothetical protein
MAIRVGINALRSHRSQRLRAATRHPEIEIVAVNDITKGAVALGYYRDCAVNVRRNAHRAKLLQ